MKKIWIVSLFPEFFEPMLKAGVIGQALRGERKLDTEIDLELLNMRDYSTNDYKNVDDSPFGGGVGMVIKADVLFECLQGIISKGSYSSLDQLHVVYTSPRGAVWNDTYAREFASKFTSKTDKDLVFICGRYEGVDERFLSKYVNEYISIGDYVLSGGELAVMSIIDSAMRFIPGVLGNNDSSQLDSFGDGLLEHPQYTRPREFQGMGVPEVLLSGHHKKIDEYQKQEQEKMTKECRPDLWKKYQGEGQSEK